MADNKKNILMVHNFYQIGGGEHTVFKNEIEMLRTHGHSVYTYTRSNDELKDSKLKLLLSPFSTIWSFKTYREIRRIIEKENIEIVHCHNTFPLISPSAYYAARSKQVPVVQTIHNFRFLCPGGVFYCKGKICEECRQKQSFVPALKNKCYRNSTVQTAIVAAMLNIHRKLGTYQKISYIFLTEFNRDKFNQLIDINRDNVFIKPNFVEKRILDELTDKKDPHKFIFASRLEENKGIINLLEAWEDVPLEYQLYVYGDGSLKKKVSEICEQMVNVHFLGFCSQDVIFRELRSSVAMIFPSLWYEGFPMIIAESFALGCPVVSTNIGNQGDLIRHSGAGIEYDPADVNSFSSAIKEISADYQNYSNRARRFFEEHLNEDNNYNELKDIYNAATQMGRYRAK